MILSRWDDTRASAMIYTLTRCFLLAKTTEKNMRGMRELWRRKDTYIDKPRADYPVWRKLYPPSARRPVKIILDNWVCQIRISRRERSIFLQGQGSLNEIWKTSDRPVREHPRMSYSLYRCRRWDTFREKRRNQETHCLISMNMHHHCSWIRISRRYCWIYYTFSCSYGCGRILGITLPEWERKASTSSRDTQAQ